MSKLSELGMWASWQETVKAALPNFARCPIYVEQNSVPESQFYNVTADVLSAGEVDPGGRIRDAEFGARVVNVDFLGPVTRMWLDGNVEIDFLRRSLPSLSEASVLDIGAGYGRLAVMLRPFVKDLTCVDAVPISTQLCRGYTQRFAPTVKVMDLADFEANPPQGIDLAINIHSWNECKLSQIKNWLDVLDQMQVPFLFTVSHGQLNHKPEPSYRAWGDDHPDFRHLLEARYALVKEESLGLSPNPHALWRRL